MKFYSLSSGKLAVLWVIGVIIYIVSNERAAAYPPSGIAAAIGILVPIALIVYSIAWYRDHKEVEQTTKDLKNGIHGWFRFLLFYYFAGYLYILTQPLTYLQSLIKVFSINTAGLAFLVFYFIFFALNAALFYFSYNSIYKLKSNAIAFLRMGLISGLFALLFNFEYLATPPATANGSQNLKGTIFIMYVILYVYSHLSSRVRNTFPIKERKIDLKVKVLSALLSISLVCMLAIPSLMTGFDLVKPIQTDIKWINFNSPDGKFDILFPEYPTTQNKTVQGQDSTENFEMTQYVSDPKNGMGYTLVYLTYPSDIERGDENALFKKYFDGIAGSGIDKSSYDFTSWQGHSAMNFQVDSYSDNRITKGRIVIAQKTFFVVAATGKKQNFLESNYDKYINSFKVNTVIY